MIKELIRGGESKTVEFKEGFPQKNQIPKSVCAFANRAGGHIIIGVNDKGEIVGVEDELLDEYLDRISNMVHDNVYPMLIPELYTYKIENRAVIVVQVYPGNTPPYFLKSEGKTKGTYVRVGKTNKAADQEMLQELERRRWNKTYDEDIYREVDRESVMQLIKMLEVGLEKEITEKRLESLNLILPIGEALYFSHAAAIILGKMEHCRIKCARFAGDSVLDFIDRKEYTGDVFSQLTAAIGFVKSHIHMTSVITGIDVKRKDVFEIPEEVFREAIVNAILHRDYSISGSDIKIAVYNSRIEIISPGGLPKTITIEEIYAGRSEIRNKILARIFREAGIMEQWGSGIPRIREACERAGLRVPELSEDGMYVRLTIFRRTQESVIKEKKSDYTADTTKASQIKEEKERIFTLIKHNENFTVKDIASIIGISEASAQRRLDALQKDRKIRRVGSKKTGIWEVVGK